MMINIQLTLIHMKSTQNLTRFLSIYSYYFNMGFVAFFGRILIVTALVSSAYHHLNKPINSVEQFKNNYNTIDQLSNQYLQYDLTYQNFNWQVGVRIFGLFQALVACMIVMGDPIGGVLYIVSVTIQLFFLLWPRIASKNYYKWNYNQLEQISHFVVLLGIGLILTSKGGHKNHKH